MSKIIYQQYIHGYQLILQSFDTAIVSRVTKKSLLPKFWIETIITYFLGHTLYKIEAIKNLTSGKKIPFQNNLTLGE